MNPMLNILLIEDDDVAIEAVQRGLKKYGLNCTVTVAENGKEGLKILHGEHITKNINSPYVILLDLNMPIMNGFEFLEHIRKDENLSNSVIFILTTSNEDSDRSRAYHSNVAGFMVKSSVGPQFAKLSSLLDAYKTAVQLPK